jgi:major membrane immunogen (membrane-anchored lipoprotein)
MKFKIAKIVGVVVACSLLAACGSTEYLITKNDGTIIQAYGKPKVDEKSGMVSYRDEEGRSMQMQREDVNQIIER